MKAGLVADLAVLSQRLGCDRARPALSHDRTWACLLITDSVESIFPERVKLEAKIVRLSDSDSWTPERQTGINSNKMKRCALIFSVHQRSM